MERDTLVNYYLQDWFIKKVEQVCRSEFDFSDTFENFGDDVWIGAYGFILRHYCDMKPKAIALTIGVSRDKIIRKRGNFARAIIQNHFSCERFIALLSALNKLSLPYTCILDLRHSTAFIWHVRHIKTLYEYRDGATAQELARKIGTSPRIVMYKIRKLKITRNA